tara:strand:- start:2550 stop:4496 length:1947 start_codon:yes stop_codon:yes gene_type:complete
MVMQSLRSGTNGGAMKYLLLGLLVLAVGGFLLADVGDSFRGGLGSRDVAKVEGKAISMNDFGGTVNRRLRNYNLTPQQAYQMGLINQILTGEIRARLAKVETENLGINMPKERVKTKIAETLAPMVQDGQTMQQTLEGFLRIQGLDETQLVEGINRELSIDILIEAVQAGYMGPLDQLSQDLFQSQNQTRDIDILVFPNSEVKDVPAPTEDQLKKLYEAYKNSTYSIPQKRDVTIALIDMDAITIAEPSEEELKDLYEDNIDEYKVPENYVMSQALVKDREEAQKIYDLANSGKSLKDSVIEITGSDSSYFDKIPFDMTLVPKPIQEAMQGQPIGTMKGPIKTTLGYHVTKLISISPPMTRPFEQVRAKLVEELKVIKEEDQFYEYSVLFDDLIVNGASLEEIAKEVPLIITPIAGIQLLSQPSDISPFDTAKELFTEEQEGDKTEIIKETFALQNEGETSPLLELPSGRYIAIALDKITEKSSKPFDQVKDEIKATYIADQQAAQNTENVNAMIKQIQSGDIDFTSLAAEHKDKLQRIEDIGLRSIIAPPLTEAIRPSIFQAKLNTPYMVNLDDQNAKAIINVISFDIPEITENQKDQLATISVKVDQELKDEVFGQYIMSLYNKYDIEINDGLLRAVFGQRDTQEP